MARLSKRYLEMARQQFVGFRHAQAGYAVEQLVEGMGLTAAEWDVLRGEVSLSEHDKLALDRHFDFGK